MVAKEDCCHALRYLYAQYMQLIMIIAFNKPIQFHIENIPLKK